MIAGLEEVSEGVVLIGDEVMNDVVPPAVAWQWSSSPYALYPHHDRGGEYGLRAEG